MNKQTGIIGAAIISVMLGTAGMLAAMDNDGSATKDQDAKAALKAKAEGEKSAASQQCEAEHRQKKLHYLQKEIEECEKRVTDLKDKQTGDDRNALTQKKIDFQTQQIVLLKQMQAALENGDLPKVKALEEQRFEATSNWSCDEFAANWEAEKEKLSEKLKGTTAPEAKAACDDLNQQVQQIIAKMRQKVELEKEIKRLKGQAEETRSKAHKLACESKPQAKPAQP